MLKLPPGIHRKVTESGKVKYYYHPGRGTPSAGPRVRLPDNPHSTEFWAKLAELRGVAVKPAAVAAERKTIRDFVMAYLGSPHVSKLGEKTRYGYALYLTQLSDALGDHAPEELKPHGVAKLRDNLIDKPATANRFIKSISALYSWGREHGWTETNPAMRIRKLKGGEHEPWPEDCLALIPQVLPEDVAWPHIVALHTGQRLGDVLRMHSRDIEGGALWVTQGKTKKKLLIPLHSAIRDRVLATKGIICKRKDGRQWTEAHFQSAVDTAYLKKIAVPLAEAGLVFHGLRKNATVKLLEAGCSEAETAAVTGMSLAMVMHYGKGVRQKMLAKSAMKKVELYRVQDEDGLSS